MLFVYSLAAVHACTYKGLVVENNMLRDELAEAKVALATAKTKADELGTAGRI